MRALLQRVKNASVTVDGKLVSSIDAGLLVLLGVQKGDTGQEAEYLARKTADLNLYWC